MSTALDQATTTADGHDEAHFRRVLGLPSLVLFGLAYMVPLTVWTTYGVVATSTRGFLTTAYIVTTARRWLKPRRRKRWCRCAWSAT